MFDLVSKKNRRHEISGIAIKKGGKIHVDTVGYRGSQTSPTIKRRQLGNRGYGHHLPDAIFPFINI